MKYNIISLLKDHYCRVVFVSDPKDSFEIENAVYERDLRYKVEINAEFMPTKKVGPFKIKNKKSVWDICKKTKKVKEEGLEFLSQQLKCIDLYYYQDRSTRALSNQQRSRASILYEVMNGDRCCLLLNDCYSPLNGELVTNKGKLSFFAVASWLEKYPGFKWDAYEYIWITDMSMNEFFEQMGDNAFSSDRYRYFTAENGEITLQDTKKLKESFESAKQKEDLKSKEEAKPKRDRYTLEEFAEALKKVDLKFDEHEDMPDEPEIEETPLNPYMSVFRVFQGGFATMIVAQLITGKISVQDRFKNDRTGKVYKTTSFRYINSIQNFDETSDDYCAYLKEVDASKDSRMFVFFIDGSCDIEEGDYLSKI